MVEVERVKNVGGTTTSILTLPKASYVPKGQRSKKKKIEKIALLNIS
jgi:hypothetical protein